jgi:hypothetical protein
VEVEGKHQRLAMRSALDGDLVWAAVKKFVGWPETKTVSAKP